MLKQIKTSYHQVEGFEILLNTYALKTELEMFTRFYTHTHTALYKYICASTYNINLSVHCPVSAQSIQVLYWSIVSILA